MISYLTYLLTGLATGSQVWMSLMMGVWGAPAFPAQRWALLGALGWMVAAQVVMNRPRLGAGLALVASAASWSLYGPAIASLSANAIAWWLWIPVSLLLAGTLLAGGGVLGRDRPRWAFPGPLPRSLRRGVLISEGVVVLGLAALWLTQMNVDRTYTWAMYRENPSPLTQRCSDGTPNVVLRYREFPSYFETFCSPPLNQYLAHHGEADIPVELVVTNDLRRSRGYSVQKVGGLLMGDAHVSGGSQTSGDDVVTATPFDWRD